MATFLVTSEPDGYRATVTLTDEQPAPNREVTAQVRIDPPDAAEDASWVQMTSWQGGGRVVDRLERTGPGTYESTKPVPVYGDWKTMLRLHEGNALLGVPVYLPEDTGDPGARGEGRAAVHAHVRGRDEDPPARAEGRRARAGSGLAAPLTVLADLAQLHPRARLGPRPRGRRRGGGETPAAARARHSGRADARRRSSS